MTELDFLKAEREKIKNILIEYTHEDPHYYSVYLNTYKNLSTMIESSPLQAL